MKNKLFSFDKLCNSVKNLISEATNDENPDVAISTDVSALINGKKIPKDKIKITTSEDTEQQEIIPQNNQLISDLQIKLTQQLEEIKKKAYASKLYSTKVGNNPNALKDYGYFLGQKDLLYSILKDLATINPINL